MTDTNTNFLAPSIILKIVAKSSALPGGHRRFGEEEKYTEARYEPLIVIFAGESKKNRKKDCS